jgi:hypothetical protein
MFQRKNYSALQSLSTKRYRPNCKQNCCYYCKPYKIRRRRNSYLTYQEILFQFYCYVGHKLNICEAAKWSPISMQWIFISILSGKQTFSGRKFTYAYYTFTTVGYFRNVISKPFLILSLGANYCNNKQFRVKRKKHDN